MKYYKVLHMQGQCMHGTGCWFLPSGKRKGKWMPKIETLKVCRSGYHLARRRNLLEWIGPEMFEVEVKPGEMIKRNSKVVVGQARLIKKMEFWNVQKARLFACDCAQRLIKRVRKPLRIALQKELLIIRKYARGQVPENPLRLIKHRLESIHGYAEAGYDAIFSVQKAAAAPVDIWYHLRDAVWYAAEGVSQNAIKRIKDPKRRSSVRRAAYDAEYVWQTKRLFEYLDGKRG